MNHFRREFKVGPHRVSLAFSGREIKCEWEPIPRRLSKKRIAEYVEKRDACLAALAEEFGCSVMVVTPETGGVTTIRAPS